MYNETSWVKNTTFFMILYVYYIFVQETYPHLAELLEGVAVTAEDETDFHQAAAKHGSR